MGTRIENVRTSALVLLIFSTLISLATLKPALAQQADSITPGKVLFIAANQNDRDVRELEETLRSHLGALQMDLERVNLITLPVDVEQASRVVRDQIERAGASAAVWLAPKHETAYVLAPEFDRAPWTVSAKGAVPGSPAWRESISVAISADIAALLPEAYRVSQVGPVIGTTTATVPSYTSTPDVLPGTSTSPGVPVGTGTATSPVSSAPVDDSKGPVLEKAVEPEKKKPSDTEAPTDTNAPPPGDAPENTDDSKSQADPPLAVEPKIKEEDADTAGVASTAEFRLREPGPVWLGLVAAYSMMGSANDVKAQHGVSLGATAGFGKYFGIGAYFDGGHELSFDVDDYEVFVRRWTVKLLLRANLSWRWLDVGVGLGPLITSFTPEDLELPGEPWNEETQESQVMWGLAFQAVGHAWVRDWLGFRVAFGGDLLQDTLLYTYYDDSALATRRFAPTLVVGIVGRYRFSKRGVN